MVPHNIFNVNKWYFMPPTIVKKKRLLNDCSTELAEIWRNEPQREMAQQGRAGGISCHSPPRNSGWELVEHNITCHVGTGEVRWLHCNEAWLGFELL